ncbi:MAG: GntR family transcriptional regulator [Rhodobacteraceae bacterium]|jgi:GntR family colanic acid and biofilm gene transcriptional regulator|nr:GntR family transcriptional regulator [Paracoccaceae bacterium]
MGGQIGGVARRRGRPQSAVPPFDAIDPTLDEPVERQVYRVIRRGVMQGLVPPDAVLSSRAVAQHLNLSAQPVRDALKRLEADGVVEGRPQSGFHLPRTSRTEYWQLIEIRVRLEGLAGRLAVPNLTAGVIADLRRRNAAMAHKERSEDYLADNFAFHFTIYTEARRPALLALIENFWVRIGPILHHHPAATVTRDIVTRHEAIIAALERGDTDAVEAAIALDLEAAARVVMRHLDD